MWPGILAGSLLGGPGGAGGAAITHGDRNTGSTSQQGRTAPEAQTCFQGPQTKGPMSCT